MGKGLLMALVSGVISFFVFLSLGSFINREFNLEDIPGWVQMVLTIIVGFMLFLKRDLFFGGPILSGASIGFALAILWNIKDSVFMSRFFRIVFSLRFILLACITALGLLRKSFMTGIWDRYLTGATSGMKLLLTILAVAVYILGSILLLYYGTYRSKRRYSQFSMNKKISRHSAIIGSIVGAVMIFLSSGLFREMMLIALQSTK